MDFFEQLAIAKWMLERLGRISQATLKRELRLDDRALEELKYELIVGQRVAKDDNNEALVWTGPDKPSTKSERSGADYGARRQTVPDRPQPSEKSASGSSPAPSSKADAERRQLTVMFCDLVGSTALSSKLDPEDLRQVIADFQDHCRGAIEQYQGFIARYMGDGLLVYFGYPRAHEDDAERAVRAALDIVGSMSHLNATVGEQFDAILAVRVGVATGPVVVGDIVGEGAAEEAAVVGETPNLAARLQGVAEPNQVAVASTTRQLLGDLFEYEDLGAHELKGIPGPVTVWRVVGEGESDSRYEAKRGSDASPLVGRQEELGLLVRSWQAAKQGHGQVVLIQGEAGIGKSRLLEALREHVAGDEYLWVASRCSPYHANSALYPVVEHLKRAMGWMPEDSVEEKVRKLEALLNEQSLPLEELVPLYADLLSLPLPEGRYKTLDLKPKQKREATLDALAGWLLETAERTPVLYVWEDLHWADPTTLELLGLYIDQSPTVSMLNVLTYRPEFAPPWAMHSHMTPITLNRLERPEVEVLMEHQAAEKSLPTEVVDHVVVKADGVPLYVEELTKTILESDYLQEEARSYRLNGALSELAIPATLQDSLMARLDRLPTLREIAQLGSVIGREFAYQMLCSLTPHEESVVQAGLERLVEDELLYQRGRPPRSRYIFKHALIQDAAYQSLLRRTRQQYHEQVAKLLEEQFPETVQTHPELLAHHYQEAGMASEAVAYWYLAGERGRSRSANLEAVAHLNKGISLVEQLANEREQAKCELKLQFSLGGVYLQMRGHSAPEAEAAFARARELCLRVGDAPELVPVLFGLWRTYVVQMSDGDKPKEVAAQLLCFAQQDKSAVSLVIAHYAVGFTAYVLAEFSDAREHLRDAVGFYSSDDRETASVYRFGQDPGVACHAYLALTEWTLGQPDKAVDCAQEGMALAGRLDDAFSMAFSLVFASFLHQFRGNPNAALEAANQALSVSEEKGFPYWIGIGRVIQGWAESVVDPSDDGVRELKDRIQKHRATGTDLFAPYFLCLLADLGFKANRTDECDAALREARSVVDKTGERTWESEIYRLEGVLLMDQGGDLTDIEACFKKALAIARQNDARSLELRVVMSLSHLWQRSNRVSEAQVILTELLGQFAEGFDTTDLKEAKHLLEQLGTPTSALDDQP